MDYSIKDLVEWSNTAQGIFFMRMFGVFIAGEIVSGIVYKFMGLVDLSKKKEQIIVELSGYGANIIIGSLLAFLLRSGNTAGSNFMTGMWFVIGSMGMHLVYKRYIDKWLKIKARGKK